MKRNILLLLCLLAGINAFAYDAQIDGIYYNFSGDEATVTYLIFNDSHNSSAYPREVVIPSSVTYYGKPYSVTSIGDYAFYYCSSLRYITIPGSVTSIGNYAFYNCSRLTSVTIQDGVTSIGNCAFYQCSDLTFITIPDGVTSIGYNAFSGTKWYNYQPDGMVYVGKVAYKYKGAMPSDTSITLEEGTLEISGGAFEGCSGLTSVTIPNSVTSIGESTFRNCSGLTSITIPGSVTSIGSSAFYNCYNLTSITIPESVTSIGSNAFSGTAWYNYQPDGLVYAGKVAYIYKGTMPSDTQITLEEGTVGIANYAFNGRKDLTSVTIPNSVTSIGQYAFAGCSGLTSITIPNSVTSIGYAAFSECTGLSSITLPNSVTSIGGYAFAYNRNLTSIIIPNSVTSIGEGAFECTGITSVIIPDGITSIEPRTFYGSDLTTVTIPNSVTNIGASAFEQSGLTSVTIGSGVKIVGDKAFYNCNRLTAVHITDLVAWCNISFGKNESQPLYRAHHLYLNGEEIKDLVIPDGVTSIRYLTFDSCSGLTSVSIPNSVTSIGVSAFWSCTGLTSITIPNSVTSIGSSAFSGCSGLTDIYCYADSVPTAGTNTFTNYTAKLHVPTGSVQAYKTTEPWSGFGSNIEGYFITFADDNVKAICVAKWDTDGDGELNINEAAAVTNLGTTFKSNKQITSFDELKYFTGLTSVGSQAFYECRSMTSIIIPENVTSIGQTAFWGCSSLTSVNIPSKVTTIGKDAFAGCTALTAVNITDLSAWCNISFVSTSSQPLGNAHKLYLNGQEITKLNTPSDVIKINNYAFRGCTGLTSVVLSSSVLSIGERCFGDCSGLTDVYIPSSVTSVGSFAFYNCTALTDVYCYTEDVPNTNTNAFTSSNYKAATLHVLDVAEEAFRTTLPWKDFGTIEVISPYISFANQTVKDICIANWDINGDGEMTLEEAAAVTDLGTVFKGKAISSFDELQYFTGLTSIGNNAFQGCSGLTSITIPENVTSIGRQAFSGCSGLTAVHITDLAAWCNISADLDYGQPLYFAHHLYLNDQEITNLVIPNSVTSIGVQAFRGCSGLTSITIPNSVTSIGGYAFAYCTGLTSITIPGSVTSIGYDAFSGCSGLTSVTIPNSVTSIGEGAFYNCSGLTSITIPGSVTSIGKYAFNGSKLRNVLVKCVTPPSIVIGTGTRNDGTFSNQTLYHAMLYIPTGSWDVYAYDDKWYLFHNIRETALTEEQVSGQQAYTLMDAGTFAYSVYDPVNECIGNINSAGNIDENNPNHSWQMIEVGGMHYLYNIGAKKFVKRNGNSLALTSNPEPIDVANGTDGIVLAEQTDRQWALVCNESLSVEQAIITGVDDILQQAGTSCYDLQGRLISNPQKGINILRYSDGTTRKVLVK